MAVPCGLRHAPCRTYRLYLGIAGGVSICAGVGVPVLKNDRLLPGAPPPRHLPTPYLKCVAA